MGRLIDADELKSVFTEKSTEAVCGAELCKAIISRIDDAPTVDAVPVEWIEVDIEASAFSGYDIHSYEVATMLEEWKEKERKEEWHTQEL